MNRARTPFQTNNPNHNNQPEQRKLHQPKHSSAYGWAYPESDDDDDDDEQ